MTESTEIALLEFDVTPEQYPDVYKHGGLDQFYSKVESVVLSEVPDITTAKGRARIISLAAKVSSSKVAVEKPGREYLKSIKALPKEIETELREFTQKMDKLRDKVREPVTILEEAEKARIARIQDVLSRIDTIAGMPTADPQANMVTLAAWLDDLNAIEITDDLEEFKESAKAKKEAAFGNLNRAINARQQFDNQQLEIERLRKAQEERDRIERERQIAEKAKHEAEIQAERDKAEVEARAKAAEERLVRQQQEANEREQQARDQERQRIAQEKLEFERQEAARAADKENQRKVNNEILQAVMQFCVNEKAAKALVSAMIRGEVPNVGVKY